MSIVTQQIKSDREYKSVISNVLQQLSSDRPYPMSVTGLGEGAAEVFYAELISDCEYISFNPKMKSANLSEISIKMNLSNL